MSPLLLFNSMIVIAVALAMVAFVARGTTLRTKEVTSWGEKPQLIRPFLMMQFDADDNHNDSQQRRYESMLSSLPFPAPWDVRENTTSPSEEMSQQGQRHRKARRKKNGSLFFRNTNKCQTLRMAVKKQDIIDNIIQSDFGHAFRVDFFMNNKKVGDWYENVIYTKSDGTQGSGTISVVFNKNSAISLNGVVNQRQLPITGGSGVYQRCPGGYAQPIKETQKKVTFQFNLCEAC